MLLNIYKPQGMTPLDVIKQIRKKMPEYKNEIIGFAGRLDPLAHGVLLLMIDEETNKERAKYLNLPKEYEFEVVFGMATDTYDALGLLLPEQSRRQTLRLANAHSEKKIQEFIQSKLGKQTQTYPPFSSKTVNGKPLFWWTKEEKLSEIEIPKREIEIYDFKLLEINQISETQLKEEIMRQIDLVKGDFRQKEIKEKWEIFLTKAQNKIFQTAKFSIFCSSGTYVRSLANELGEKLETGAITIDIKRTKVGDNLLENSVILQK